MRQSPDAADGTLEEKFSLRYTVTSSNGGIFRRLLCAREVMINTLHGQGLCRAGEPVVIDGYAHGGTAGATFIRDAPSFTLSAQSHPEWNATNDPVSRPLFPAFGDAVRARAEERRVTPMLRSA